MKTHRLKALTPGAAPAYLANGLVGLRVNPIPLPRGTALVGGFVGRSPELATEEYADAPYPVGADIQWRGVWLSARPDQAGFISQQYDFSCGELTSRFAFRSARIEVLTFCSRTQPTLTVQQITLEVDEPGPLVLQAHIDQRELMGQLAYRCMPAKTQDGVIRWESRGGLSSVGAAYATEFTGADLRKRQRNDYGHEQDMELTRYHLDAKPGQRYVLRQYGALVPSLMHGEPHWQAARHVGYAQWLGFDKLRADNRSAWAELWKSRPVLVGADPHWQEVADAAFFYVHSSVTPSSPCSVAPFGLSRRAEYSGHVFWDADGFVMPAVLLSAPGSAQAMLEYRGRCLPAAKHNAQLNGLAGVQFPWQSGNHGSEVTPFYALGGMAEHHINLDIALAMAQYVHATGDDLFFRQRAWPVMEGVAEWITSRVTRTARGYEILHVTGPDETFDNVHNSAYTNMAASLVLREAFAFAQRLGLNASARWTDIAQHFYLPIDARNNLLLKHDGYTYTGGMCAPDVLVGFWPLDYRPGPTIEAATYRFYAERADTYLGMPMFSSFFSVWAARHGDRRLAHEMLAKGIGENLLSPYHQFSEATARHHQLSDAGVGVFLTNAAGFLMACYLGWPGIQIGAGEPQDWGQHPVVLPQGWEAVEVERIWVRGQPLRLQAKDGAPRATLTECSPKQ